MTGDAIASPYAPVRKLAATDQTDAFDCGQAALNQFLQRYALVNQKANSAQTYVCCQGDVVVGFYSLAVGSVDPDAAPSRVMKGLARHPVPVMILARLAVDREHQRKGLVKLCSRMHCYARPRPPTSPAFAACWCTPRMMRRGAGTSPGNSSPARPIRITCS